MTDNSLYFIRLCIDPIHHEPLLRKVVLELPTHTKLSVSVSPRKVRCPVGTQSYMSVHQTQLPFIMSPTGVPSTLFILVFSTQPRSDTPGTLGLLFEHEVVIRYPSVTFKTRSLTVCHILPNLIFTVLRSPFRLYDVPVVVFPLCFPSVSVSILPLS